ncbi:MarR family winged helix-turn-helix transcriptional regulator [Feifania hominis]|uniref:MarR family transcriptional regulator n=1 Tax=Feifania hominis TaxID=2763660 RepID=A0A926DBQ5_9FIRM|nr:MarR family transcriptional regulator [Feifania hominis]MBC8536035.1 MarR family transcriptional regulator [Feifania hominis]
MLGDSHAKLNSFLVRVFHDILRIEEQSLSKGEFGDLSMREMHIIESICEAGEQGADNRTTAIAREQGITNGTLTVAVNSLVKKGYVRRAPDERDRRVVRLYPTERAREANAAHAVFHHDMVSAVIHRLSGDEVETLVRALSAIENYFEAQRKH